MDYLHQITVYQSIGDHNFLISPSTEVKTLSQQFSAEDIQLFYQIGLKGREEIHLAPTLVIGFNMTVLRMLTFRPAASVTTIPLSLPKEVPPAPINIQKEYTDVAEKIPEEDIISDTIQAEEKHVVSNENQDWTSIIPHLKLTGLARNAIENAELFSKEGRNIVLHVAKGHQSLFTPTVLTRIETALGNYYQSPIKITLNNDQPIQSSPVQQKKQATQQKQQKAEDALHNDPMFQQLQQEFSAELVKNSIVSLKNDL